MLYVCPLRALLNNLHPRAARATASWLGPIERRCGTVTWEMPERKADPG
ncbi:MAG: hypothetical protein V9E83_07275 [Baekduia sp.]